MGIGQNQQQKKMNKVLHKANSRGTADYGWLKAAYSFSFANYYNPERIHFGMLRVLNDDIIGPGMGFGTHPHENMEIVTIPFSGSLEHKDSMGNHGVIKPSEVQIMSAGTGIEHSEFNHSKTEEVRLFQIWVFPKEKNIAPRYDQRHFKTEDRLNKFQTIVSPEKNNESMWINQEAWFSLGNIEKDKSIKYKIHSNGNGIYLFIVEGNVLIEDQELERRDAIGISETDSVTINTKSDSEILVIEIPMR